MTPEPALKAFMPPSREYLTQYSAVRWESGEHTMGESKARDPMVVEPRRWYALGATVCNFLW